GGWLAFLWARGLFPGEPSPGARPRPSSLLILLVLPAALLYPCLRFDLFEPDETRYAQIPREMLLRGEWVVPLLQGQPYLDKPPLLYWAVMGSYSLFGVHDWAARLVPALAGMLTIAVAWLWARRVAGRRAALLGALLLAPCAGYIYYGRMLTMDAPLALFTTATLAAGHAAMHTPRGGRWLWLLAGVCCGMGLLTKGPVALALTLPPLLAVALLDSRCLRPKLSSW